MTETKPRPQISPSTTSSGSSALDMFLELVATRDMDVLLEQALALLTRIFHAEAGSILVQAYTPQRLRMGQK